MLQQFARRIRRLTAAVMLSVACALGMALPAAADPSPSAAQSSSAAVNPGARAAILVVRVQQSGSSLMSSGTLKGQRGNWLTGKSVNLKIDGATKATATVGDDGSWQVSTPLDQIDDGNHTVGARFDGQGDDGPAEVSVQMTTRRPPQPTVLTGALNAANAGPGDKVTAKGTLQSGGKPITNATVKLGFGAGTSQAQTSGDGSFSVDATVPSSATIGTTLTATLTYDGDASHPAASLNLPLMVQKVSPTPTPSATPTPTASPSDASATPGVYSPEATGIKAGQTKVSDALGPGAILPFVLVGVLALAAAIGLGYWLYVHRNDPDRG